MALPIVNLLFCWATIWSTSSELITLLPGEDLIPVEGYYAWDFGKLGVNGDRLVYFGERTKFSAARGAISSIEAISKRAGLGRTHGVRIRTSQGTFIVLEATQRTSRRGAARLERKWTQWWMGEAEAAPANRPPFEFPPLELPVRPTEPPPRSPVKPLVVIIVLQLVAGILISALLPQSSLNDLATLAGPFLYFLVMSPVLIAWKRMPRPPAGDRPPVEPAPPAATVLAGRSADR